MSATTTSIPSSTASSVATSGNNNNINSNNKTKNVHLRDEDVEAAVVMLTEEGDDVETEKLLSVSTTGERPSQRRRLNSPPPSPPPSSSMTNNTKNNSSMSLGSNSHHGAVFVGVHIDEVSNSMEGILTAPTTALDNTTVNNNNNNNNDNNINTNSALVHSGNHNTNNGLIEQQYGHQQEQDQESEQVEFLRTPISDDAGGNVGEGEDEPKEDSNKIIGEGNNNSMLDDSQLPATPPPSAAAGSAAATATGGSELQTPQVPTEEVTLGTRDGEYFSVPGHQANTTYSFLVDLQHKHYAGQRSHKGVDRLAVARIHCNTVDEFKYYCFERLKGYMRGTYVLKEGKPVVTLYDLNNLTYEEGKQNIAIFNKSSRRSFSLSEFSKLKKGNNEENVPYIITVYPYGSCTSLTYHTIASVYPNLTSNPNHRSPITPATGAGSGSGSMLAEGFSTVSPKVGAHVSLLHHRRLSLTTTVDETDLLETTTNTNNTTNAGPISEIQPAVPVVSASLTERPQLIKRLKQQHSHTWLTDHPDNWSLWANSILQEPNLQQREILIESDPPAHLLQNKLFFRISSEPQQVLLITKNLVTTMKKNLKDHYDKQMALLNQHAKWIDSIASVIEANAVATAMEAAGSSSSSAIAATTEASDTTAMDMPPASTSGIVASSAASTTTPTTTATITANATTHLSTTTSSSSSSSSTTTTKTALSNASATVADDMDTLEPPPAVLEGSPNPAT